MSSASFWEMFGVNFPILPLTKTPNHTGHQVGNKLGLTETDFSGKFTTHSQILASSSSKANSATTTSGHL